MALNGRKPSAISETGSRFSRVAEKARFRWLIFVLCHFAVFSVTAISSALTITINAMMHDEKNMDPTAINSTLSSFHAHHEHVSWNGVQKDRMLQAFFWGSLATSILGGRFGEVFGPRRAISLALFSAGSLFLLLPVVALNSFWAAYAIRVTQGVSYGIVLPTIGVIVSRWSPQHESTLSNMVAISGYFAANILVHPIAGMLVSGNFLGGWPSVFYLFGCFSLFMVIPWYFLVYDDPESHPRLSPGELEEIVQTRSLKTGVSKKIPWLKILTSPPVLAYLSVYSTYDWLLALVSTQIPSFYEEVLEMSHEKNGFMTSIAWILGLTAGAFASAIADKIRRTNRFTQTSLRKAFTCIALGGSSAAIFMLTFTGKNNIAAVALVTTAKGIGTFTMAGASVNHLDIAPSFAGTLAGMSYTMSSLAALAMNEAVARIVGNQPTADNWYKFFYLTSAWTLVGAILFCIFASGEVQKWDPSWQAKEPVEKKNSLEENNNSSIGRLSSLPGNVKIEMERKY